MVILDPDSDDVVIRVVYDGPPEAGKTTSVRALAGSLGRPMYTPDHIDGRTVYFDWLDYTGGLFEGHHIRCQVVSVPGQATLAPRRRALLADADVVVFVADTRREHMAGLPGYLQGLGRILAAAPGPPVGLVVQANKRDLPGAVAVPEVRRLLEAAGLRVGIVESIATDGAGIRETFVFAVRLALDRAREQLRVGQLETARPRVATGEQLLAALKAAEGGALDLAAGERLTHTRLSEVTLAGDALGEAIGAEQTLVPEVGRMWHPETPGRERLPLAPSAAVAGGLIWPPVKGRLTLHEAGENPVSLARGEDGDWYGLAGDRFRLQSPANASFGDLDRGRAALVEWARIHSASSAVLSGDRCIALAKDHGGYRLWQIVRVEPSIAERLDEAPSLAPREAAALLVECAQTFLDAARVVPQAACRLPLTFASIRAFRVGAPYVGLMPAPAFVRPPELCPPSMAEELLGRELSPYLRGLAARRQAVEDVLTALSSDGPSGAACAAVRSLWAAM